MEESDLYYLWLDEKAQGPFTVDQLRAMWFSGKIFVTTKYCQEGWENWEELSLIQDTLFAVHHPEYQPNKPAGLPRYSAQRFNTSLEPVPLKSQYHSTGYSGCKSKITYQLLAFFLGGLGVHNFYASRNNVAIVQLIVSLVFYWTIVVPLFVWLIAFGEFFTVDRDGDGQLMV